MDNHVWVPALWYTEVLHVLRCAENDRKFGQSSLTAFAYNLAQLPIEMDPTHPSEILLAVAAICREFKLSGYDAQSLELAHRRNLPLATLDKDLRKAALKAGVPTYTVSAR
jgi:predicted nucleic acid-binding protein